ncbi:MAG: SynChlorMet cassette protein ScmC [Syntrophales bacterium]|nr:SynChlorMet cassette protein ScmC [Syntrophales bacterium]
MKTYLLKLANGLGWNISSEPDAEAWVEILARIMSLPEKNDPAYPTIRYRMKNPQRHPDAGWSERDMSEICLLYRADSRDIICELQHESGSCVHIWSALFPVYRDVCFSGGLPLHGALAEKDGYGIILAGPADAGKSTCSRRLPAPWKILSDEESVIVPAGKGMYAAHPFPTWSLLADSRETPQRRVDAAVPLRAIFFIAKSEADSAKKAGTGKSAGLIAGLAGEKFHIDWETVGKAERIGILGRLFENAGSIALRIPAYHLGVSREGKFWEKMEEALG